MQTKIKTQDKSHFRVSGFKAGTEPILILDFKPPVICSTDRSKAVVPELVLLFVALWFILRGDLLYVFPCVILFLCFSVLLVLRLPRLGKRANLSAFRTFVRFLLVWICPFLLPLGVWEGLRL